MERIDAPKRSRLPEPAPRRSRVVPQARIIIAEPEARLRLRLAQGLREDGHLVSEAATGFELLAKLRQAGPDSGAPARPDVVICHVFLPGLASLETLAILRSLSGWPPIIVLTSDGDEAEARRLGVAAIFPRPFETDEVRMAVHDLLLDRREQPGASL